MLIYMDRATNLLTSDCKPLASGLTVEQAAERLNAMDLSPIVEVQWSVYHDVPDSIERQVAIKARRVKKLAAKIGRIVTRVEKDPVITMRWRALLAR